MSGYNIEYFLADYANRTVKNLEEIENQSELRDDLYEVTQLMNSFLGLVIIPFERYRCYNHEMDRNMKNASSIAYREINDLIAICVKQKRLFSDYDVNEHEKMQGHINVYNFIRHIRNAICHGGDHGIHFFPIAESKNITHVIFYDNNKNHTSHQPSEFCVKLSIAEIRQLIWNVSSLFCKFETRDKNAKKNIDEYNQKKELLNSLLSEGRIDKNKVIFDLTKM